VVLRPISLADAPHFVKWLNDPVVSKPLRGHHERLTLKEERAWIQGLRKKQKIEKQFSIDTADGVHIGSAGLTIGIGGKVAVFGIEIGNAEYRGKGYGFAVMSLLMGYAFTVLKLHKVELGVFAFNKHAIKLYEKVGFKIEGVRKDHLFYEGKYYDEIEMGLFRKQFEQVCHKKFRSAI
jgi:RimJ/RimL family protein N-acetyltransferase